MPPPITTTTEATTTTQTTTLATPDPTLPTTEIVTTVETTSKLFLKRGFRVYLKISYLKLTGDWLLIYKLTTWNLQNISCLEIRTTLTYYLLQTF